MGEQVAATQFSREDRTRYRQKVRRCLDVFERMLRESRFDFDRPMTGLEIELNLVDDARRPGDAQRRGAGGDRRPGLPDRAGPVQHRDQRAAADAWRATSLASWRRRLRDRPQRRREQARDQRGRHMVMIGILPTLRRDHLHRRRAVRQPALRAAQRADLRRPRRGPAHRHRRRASGWRTGCRHDRAGGGLHQRAVPPAGQPGRRSRLLERRPGDRRRPGGARRQLAVPVRPASCGGRPGSRCSSRPPTPGREELKAQGVRPRVWFGERWITSIFDLFEENVRYFPALLPICERRGPGGGARRAAACRTLGELTPAQRHHLPLEPAGLRRGRRPAAPAGGEPGAAGRADRGRHLANARLLLRPGARAGRGRPSGVDADVVRRRRGELPRRRPARHRRALFWPGLGEVPATELVLRRLLPLAAEGLRPVGGRPAASGTGCSASSSSAA